VINRTAHKQLTLLVWGASAIGALAVLAIVVAAYQVYWIMDRERESLEALRRDDLALVARAGHIRSEREAAERQLQSLTQTLADLTSRIPSSPKEAEFLAQISKLAERTGVRLKSFRPGQAALAGAVNTCDVQVSLVGPFANICKWLDGLTDVPRLLSVPRLSLAGPQSAGDACIADVTISLCFAADKK
jgi:Tfp pilus assembly protein PilO